MNYTTIMRPFFPGLCFALLIVIGLPKASGQYAETIRSGRAGLAVGPFTVGKGVLQNQSGFYATQSKTEGIATTQTNGGYFIAVFRGGLTENFELGGAISYTDNRSELTFPDTSYKESFRQEGINVATLAMRVNITEGKGLLPAFGYQINLGFPWVSEEFKAEHVAPRITLLTAQSFEKFRFITNWAAVWNGNNAEPSGIYMLFIDRGIGKKFRVFFEHYGVLNGDDIRPKFDGGLTYLINKDIQLDAQYGNGPDYKGKTDMFLSVGIGWRLRLTER